MTPAIEERYLLRISMTMTCILGFCPVTTVHLQVPPHRWEQSCQRGGKSCLRERKFPASVGLEKFNHKLGNKKAKLVKMHMKELKNVSLE